MPGAYGHHRHETPEQRIDRNWNEILQELRVIQAGSQIITGFLLAAAFQQRFEDLSPVGLGIYFALLAAAVITTVVGMTPVMVHRRLFRAGAKEPLVQLGNRLATLALIGVGLTLTGIVLLIVELTVGILAGVVAAGVTGATIAIIWILLPSRIRRRRDPRWASDDTGVDAG